MKTMSTLLLIFIATSPFKALSDGGFWHVEGSVVNVEQSVLSTKRCELPGLRLRFDSRWSNGSNCIVGQSGECPWGRKWGQDATNSSGEFSERSYHFANTTLMRDIRIQYQSLGNWHTLYVASSISGTTPHRSNGNVSIYDLGVLETTSFNCPTVLETESEQSDEGSQTGDNSGNSTDDIVHDSEHALTDIASIKDKPCGMGPDGLIRVPDLSFVLTDVRHRDGRPMAPQERITWEVTVQNNGPVDYRGYGKCGTTIEAVFEIPELNTQRSYEMNINGIIPLNGNKSYTDDANLGETSEQASLSYNVIMTINPTGASNESNAANNQGLGCYTLATETYIQSPCGVQVNKTNAKTNN